MKNHRVKCSCTSVESIFREFLDKQLFTGQQKPSRTFVIPKPLQQREKMCEAKARNRVKEAIPGWYVSTQSLAECAWATGIPAWSYNRAVLYSS